MDTKPCPHCRQDIPADSVKCHHCREWVDWRGPVKRHLLPAVGVLALFVGFMLIMDRFMFEEMFDEQKYWQQPDAIQITSHHPGEDEEGSRCVIGTMKNVSETPWRSITIQVDYYNSKGELVDTSEDWSNETLAPGQERSFKVVFKSGQRDVEYDHYRVFIAGADDASRF
jgi:hypothetical protein